MTSSLTSVSRVTIQKVRISLQNKVLNLGSVIQEFYLNAWHSLWLSSCISKQKRPKCLMEIQLKAGTGCRMNLKENYKWLQTWTNCIFYVFYFSSLKIFSFQLTVMFINFVSLFYISFFCIALFCFVSIKSSSRERWIQNLQKQSVQ